MSEGASPGAAGSAYDRGLEELGLRDVRPLYRRLLKELKEDDPPAYEEAVERYEEEVSPAEETGDDPVEAWLRYGAWMAARITPGRAAAVDGSGRARPLELLPDTGEEGGGPAADDSGGSAAEQLDIGALASGEPAADAPAAARGGRAADAQGAGGHGRREQAHDEESREGDAGPVPPGSLVLHLPDSRRRPALVLAAPARPTDHQEATRDLLCG